MLRGNADSLDEAPPAAPGRDGAHARLRAGGARPAPARDRLAGAAHRAPPACGAQGVRGHGLSRARAPAGSRCSASPAARSSTSAPCAPPRSRSDDARRASSTPSTRPSRRPFRRPPTASTRSPSCTAGCSATASRSTCSTSRAPGARDDGHVRPLRTIPPAKPPHRPARATAALRPRPRLTAPAPPWPRPQTTLAPLLPGLARVRPGARPHRRR